MSNLRQAAEQAIALICSARLCESNSMSSRQEMLRLMIEATDTLRAALAEPVQEPVWNDLKEWCKQHNISPAHYDDLYSLLMYVNITQTNLKENT